jgi:SAM-dependent methyltransferase
MVFFDIAYTDKQMKLLYSDYRSRAYAFFREKYEAGYSNLNNHLVNSVHNGQHINILNLLSTYAPNTKFTRILDYGGDRGQLIPPSLKGEKFVYELSGVDTEEGVKKINKINNKYYDFIMCTHVLEHLINPIEVLYEIKNALTDDGIIYIEVPLQLNELNNSQSETHFMHEHINFFNPKSMKSLLELAGFETIFIGEIAINNFGTVVSALAKKRL